MTSRRMGDATVMDSMLELAGWQRHALGESTLWWVTADMVDLIEASSEDLPAVAYDDALLPSESPHLAVFERPLQGTDMATGAPLLVDAMLWTRSTLAPAGGGIGPRRPGVSMMLYRRVDLDEGLRPAEMQNPSALALMASAAEDVHQRSGVTTTALHGQLWMPLGRTDWALGQDWDERILADISDHQHASMAEDRRWLATMCALAAQPNVVDFSDTSPGRPAVKRAQRAGFTSSMVRVVNLRRTVYDGAGASREPTDASGRHFTVRWPVVGHWRSQAYGPGRAYRRPTYIAPYIKGPEGAPLRRGATVHVLRAEETRK